jgi:hypothetical protein
MMADYQWDVDMGLVDKTRRVVRSCTCRKRMRPGRLRHSGGPDGRARRDARWVLALPSSLYFVGVAP